MDIVNTSEKPYASEEGYCEADTKGPSLLRLNTPERVLHDRVAPIGELDEVKANIEIVGP